MPDPASLPDHEMGNWCEVTIAGSGFRAAVGGVASMGFRAVGVAIAAFVSNTIDACAVIAVPVATPAFGRTLYVKYPCPTPEALSTGRNPASRPSGGSIVAGSSERN